MLPLALFGIGLALAALASGGSRRSRRESPLPPAQSGPPPEAVDAAEEAVRQGTPTSEDYQTLAEAAEGAGAPDAAQTFRERAEEAPLRAEVTPTPAPVATTPAPVRYEPEASAPSPQSTAELQVAPVEPSALPAGFDPLVAKRTAQAVSTNITTRGYSYSRDGLRAWQRAAGLTPDGVYGGGTRGALLFYGAANPPRALFAPTTTVDYPAELAQAAESQGV
jgi:hypothetical protein